MNNAFGTTLSWNGAVIAKLTAVNGIELSVDTIDVTNHQSTGNYKEFLPGLIDAGEVRLEGFFEYTDTAGQAAMVTDLNAGTSRTGIITFPSATGSTWTFVGYVTKLKIGDAAISGAIPFSATIKVTGKPVFASAASAGMSNLVITTATIYPAFAIGTFNYVATTTGATVTVTPTAAGVITVTANGISQTVLTTQASSAISAGAINTVTPIVIVVQETGKAPKTYTINLTKTA